MAKIFISAEFDSIAEATDFMVRGVTPPSINIQIPTAKQKTTGVRATTEKVEGTATPPAVVPTTTAAPEPIVPPVTTGTPPVISDAAVAMVIPAAAPAPTAQPTAPKAASASIPLSRPVPPTPSVNKTPITLHPATQDGVRAALKDVFNNRGATVATKILTDHGAVSVSTVSKDKYTAFVQACAAA